MAISADGFQTQEPFVEIRADSWGKSEIEQVFQFDAERFGDAGATFDGRGMNAALDETDEFDGVVRFFRQLFLREALTLPQFCNPLT